MDSRKLERIILLILLLLNVFLLSAVVSDGVQARRNDAETAAAVTALLEESGIAVSPDAVRPRPAAQKYTLTRDMTLERQKIARLLGSLREEELGGNILFYSAGRGQAVLRGSGEMDVLYGSAEPLRGGAEKAAARLLERIGIESVPAEPGDEAAAPNTVELNCCMDGVPVYNAAFHFDYQENGIYMFSGTRLFDVATKEPSDAMLDSVSVLLRFLEIIRDEGYICSRIERVEQGYLLSVTLSGEAVLAPVWRIETDAGALVIDAETGRPENWLS